MDNSLAQDKWPQALWDLVDVVESKLKTHHANDARDLAYKAVSAIAEYHGGRMFYLPKGDSLKRAITHREIWDNFNGTNIDDLVVKYKLGTQAIYDIIKKQRKLSENRRMGDLFVND